MTWVKSLLDKNYDSVWKTIECASLKKFRENQDILWISHAPESILKSLNNIQLADSLHTCIGIFFEKEPLKIFLGNLFVILGFVNHCGSINRYALSLNNSYIMKTGMQRMFVHYLTC